MNGAPSQQPALEPRIYVEIRVVKWDPATAPPITGPSSPTTIDTRPRAGRAAPADGTLDRMVLEFHNLANATAVYDDCSAVLTDAHVRGLDDALERVKAGRPPVGGRRRASGLHPLETGAREVETHREAADLHSLPAAPLPKGSVTH